MKVFQPTTSYEIALPDDIVEDHDGKVASYWRPEVRYFFSYQVHRDSKASKSPPPPASKTCLRGIRSRGFPLRWSYRIFQGLLRLHKRVTRRVSHGSTLI